MKYFFDTEFNENGKTIELISIGIVAQDGREYYAISDEYDRDSCNDWVKTFVLPYIDATGENVKERKQIAWDIWNFVGKDPEFWAWFADYDWVVMCQLYGRMVDLPRGWPQMCMDLRQWQIQLGLRYNKLPEQTGRQHNSLEDARWNKEVYHFLEQEALGIGLT